MNSWKSSLSESQLERLEQEKTPPSELITDMVASFEVIPQLLPYTQLSWEEECESSSFKPRDYYNYMIKPDKIDYIFPANDQQLFETMHDEYFLNHVCDFISCIFCFCFIPTHHDNG